jgi:hypothetical protein
MLTCIPGRDGFVKVKHQHGCLCFVHNIFNHHLQVSGLLSDNGCRWVWAGGRPCRSCCLAHRLLGLLPEAVWVAMALEPIEHVKPALQHWAHIRGSSDSLQKQQQCSKASISTL